MSLNRTPAFLVGVSSQTLRLGRDDLTWPTARTLNPRHPPFARPRSVFLGRERLFCARDPELIRNRLIQDGSDGFLNPSNLSSRGHVWIKLV